MRRILIAVALAFSLAGCPADDDAGADSGECMCPTPNAQQVSYDNVSSMLGAANVQDAIDELEARAAEPPLTGRILEVAQNVANDGTVGFSPTISCPMPGDLALGGSCGPLALATLQGSIISLDGGGTQGNITCSYSQPMGNGGLVSVRLICMRPAAQ